MFIRFMAIDIDAVIAQRRDLKQDFCVVFVILGIQQNLTVSDGVIITVIKPGQIVAYASAAFHSKEVFAAFPGSLQECLGSCPSISLYKYLRISSRNFLPYQVAFSSPTPDTPLN